MLEVIKKFLEVNPSEVITIFINDNVESPSSLTEVFTSADLMKYLFPVALMPNNSDNWPLLSDMIDKNQRLIVFTTKEALEGFAYVGRYVAPSQCMMNF